MKHVLPNELLVINTVSSFTIGQDCLDILLLLLYCSGIAVSHQKTRHEVETVVDHDTLSLLSRVFHVVNLHGYQALYRNRISRGLAAVYRPIYDQTNTY